MYSYHFPSCTVFFSDVEDRKREEKAKEIADDTELEATSQSDTDDDGNNKHVPIKPGKREITSDMSDSDTESESGSSQRRQREREAERERERKIMKMSAEERKDAELVDRFMNDGDEEVKSPGSNSSSRKRCIFSCCLRLPLSCLSNIFLFSAFCIVSL